MPSTNRLFILASFVISLLLMSCDSKTNKFNIGVSQFSRDNWREQINHEMLQEIPFYDDISLSFKDANGDNKLQRDQISEFVEQGVDMLIVIPGEESYITPTIEEAYDRGIEVVIIDNMINSDKYTAFLGADNIKIGELAGEYVTSSLNDGGRVIELTGNLYSNVAKERHKGFVKKIAETENIELIESIEGAWRELRSEEIVDSLLLIYPDIDMIYAHNDAMAYGAYKSTKKAKRDIKLIGIDALAGENNGLDLVSRGALDVSFLYPTFGNIVMQRANEILHGLPFERETRFETALVTRNNARVELLKIEQLNELDRRIKSLNMNLDTNRRTNLLQRYLLLLISIVVVITIIIAIIIGRMMRAKGRMNELLQQQYGEISQQRDQLVEMSHNLEEATNAKLLFYTNISHDLRTPITLIADPIKNLLKLTDLNPQCRDLLTIASRNTTILLRMIDQILDFRSHEHGELKLQIIDCNIEQLLREWNLNFHATLAQYNKDITLFIAPNENYNVMLDVEKVERIYFNLISNAIKYSIGDNDIEVRLWVEMIECDEYICFSVKNRCETLSASAKSSMFDRFYQADQNAAGAGVGLSISKSYSELHRGRIWADCDDKFITITVALPHQKNVAIESPIECNCIEDYDPVSQTGEPCIGEDQAVVLIVDDNSDIRQYLKFVLSKNYAVIEAKDGKEAQQLATEYIPDLIISDVMMSPMDGMTLCKHLKGELLTCHIPILLLTAYAADENRIEGYDSGADGYISKPFNSDVLLSRVSNLITGRALLKSIADAPVKIREGAIAEEHSLLLHFNNYIESHLDNPLLGVEDIGREMGYSRAQLYRKIKALTGESPNRLLRNARLLKAKELLCTTTKSISEIGYEVGFSSPSYFTKTYKEYYGSLPSDK